MLKICGDTICKPLQSKFSNKLLPLACSRLNGKKAILSLVTKKATKKTLKNYRLVSPLPICGKLFERLIFNEMFRLFLASNLLAPNRSGFNLGDSCINQSPSITQEIYSTFDDGFEVRSVFLNISKAFDKV